VNSVLYLRSEAIKSHAPAALSDRVLGVTTLNRPVMLSDAGDKAVTVACHNACVYA